MPTFKDASGRDVYAHFMGHLDDIQCDEAYYDDTGDDAPDETVEYIMKKYTAEIEFAILENQMEAAESYYEGDR